MPAEPPTIRTVIVDDEAPARALLREYLGAERDVEVVAECANGFDALKRIGDLAPELVLLDVQMPKLDGFEVLELLENRPAVVFVTAYDEYALKAFDVHAVDYVLKPVGRERLAEAIRQVRERLSSGTTGPATGTTGAAAGKSAPPAISPAALANAARGPGRHLERILIKDGANVHVIPVERVDWIEAQDDYVAIRAEGKTHLKPQTIAEIANALDPERFVRIHRSYVLNVERLARIELYAKDSRIAILKEGKQLPVSRAGYARLKELL
jgi:two-component system LytT family response regulator